MAETKEKREDRRAAIEKQRIKLVKQIAEAPPLEEPIELMNPHIGENMYLVTWTKAQRLATYHRIDVKIEEQGIETVDDLPKLKPYLKNWEMVLAEKIFKGYEELFARSYVTL